MPRHHKRQTAHHAKQEEEDASTHHHHATNSNDEKKQEKEEADALNHSLRTLSAILDDANSLAKEDFVAAREVTSLRQAFECTKSAVPPAVASHRHTKEACRDCERVIDRLEATVSAEGVEAATGDTEETEETRTWKQNLAVRNIPLRRRAQTLAVASLLFFTGPGICLTTAVLLTLFPLTAPFMILYWLWIFFGRLRHPLPKWKWFTHLSFWKYYRDYFPIRLVAHKEVRDAINPKKNYLFCYHPHGVHAFGSMLNFLSDVNGTDTMFPGIQFHLQTLKLNFYVPFWRQIGVWGGVGDASAKCLRKTLTAGPGHSAVLVVGGAEESLWASPHTNDLTLKKRKGFVKIALQTGADLVPVFSFGENNVYGNYADGHPKLQKFMLKLQKRLGFAIPLLKGRGVFTYSHGILPHRRPIITEVGMPVCLPKIPNPTQEEIDHWHGVYVKQLMALYNENKDIYDLCPKRECHVVS